MRLCIGVYFHIVGMLRLLLFSKVWHLNTGRSESHPSNSPTHVEKTQTDPKHDF